ncbi:576_t:CDS:1 [Scutellospora calospora]|uniref:576_t:CDS:1 n=1 Tax=Scutellospora calospora TaxID=85575 RepID=A0ACA9KFA2_9GLOM|nr:576_t:CDS:1 [Scutellospora calospora]
MPPNRNKLCSKRSSSKNSSTIDISQKVDEFVKQVDLEDLCSSSVIVLPGTGKNNPVARPSNCFFQFKRAVTNYAMKKVIQGRNDQNILSKAQSKLWKMITPVQKDYFRKLAEEALKIHKEKFPDYEFHPQRDKSVLKIKSMNGGGQQTKKKKNPVEKPDNLAFNQDSNNNNLNPVSNEGAFACVITTYEEGQNHAYDNTLALTVSNESTFMGSQDELTGLDFDLGLRYFNYYSQPPSNHLSATLQPNYLTPISPTSDSETQFMFQSPFPSPNSQIGDNNSFEFHVVPDIEQNSIDLQTVPSIEHLTVSIPTWQTSILDNNNMLGINMNNTPSPSSPALSNGDSNYSIHDFDNIEDMITNTFAENYLDMPFCSPITEQTLILNMDCSSPCDQIYNDLLSPYY